MKILNLYAGIGGNRKLWGDDHEITAVEKDYQIGKIYKDFFPKDLVIKTDAHSYLLEHFKKFDFIWASPPCPTHSRFNFLNNTKSEQGIEPKYPDMKLYEEIILLKTWYKGKFCIENVTSYYKPLVPCIESNKHFFWTNFHFTPFKGTKRGIRGEDHDFRIDRVGFNLTKFKLGKIFEKQIANNCVEPELGLHILNESQRDIQGDLFKGGNHGA